MLALGAAGAGAAAGCGWGLAAGAAAGCAWGAAEQAHGVVLAGVTVGVVSLIILVFLLRLPVNRGNRFTPKARRVPQWGVDKEVLGYQLLLIEPPFLANRADYGFSAIPALAANPDVQARPRGLCAARDPSVAA